MTRLGRRQKYVIDLCRGHERVRFKPTRNGHPWPEMNSLIKRGLAWVRLEITSHWCPSRQEFVGREEKWLCGLTEEGREIAVLEGRDAVKKAKGET